MNHFEESEQKRRETEEHDVQESFLFYLNFFHVTSDCIIYLLHLIPQYLLLSIDIFADWAKSKNKLFYTRKQIIMKQRSGWVSLQWASLRSLWIIDSIQMTQNELCSFFRSYFNCLNGKLELVNRRKYGNMAINSFILFRELLF